jgi:hypothetical protein
LRSHDHAGGRVVWADTPAGRSQVRERTTHQYGCLCSGSLCGRRHRCCPFAARTASYESAEATQPACLQVKPRDGSDGTRTRDLRRDRPLQALRRSATIAVESICSCWSGSAQRRLSAWLREADLRRLLPICCPGIDRRKVRRSTERPLPTIWLCARLLATGGDGFGCLGRFGRCRTCAGSPPFAPALLHNCSILGRPARHQHLARRRRLGLLLGGASRRSAAVRGQRGDRRGGLLCPRVLYVRRSELKEISPDAVDVSSFDEAKQVASVAEEERRIIEAERRRLGLDV